MFSLIFFAVCLIVAILKTIDNFTRSPHKYTTNLDSLKTIVSVKQTFEQREKEHAKLLREQKAELNWIDLSPFIFRFLNRQAKSGNNGCVFELGNPLCVGVKYWLKSWFISGKCNEETKDAIVKELVTLGYYAINDTGSPWTLNGVHVDLLRTSEDLKEAETNDKSN